MVRLRPVRARRSGRKRRRRSRRTIGLLHLGGQDSRRLEALERETRNVEQGEVDWPKLGQDLHRAWLEPQAISPDPIEPRREESWARVVPLEFGHAMLGRGSHDPVSSRQVREWTALWSWLSDRMLYEARDLHGLAFHAEAGRGYNPPGRNSPLPEVRLATDPSSLTLTSRDRSATVNLQLSSNGGSGSIGLRFLATSRESPVIRPDFGHLEGAGRAARPTGLELLLAADLAEVAPF